MGHNPRQNKYMVFVNENAHYMDAEARYKHGEYESCEAAICECERIVDSFLFSSYREGMAEEELWELYTVFGEDPFIVAPGAGCSFSAWEYARRSCGEMCSRAKQ